PPFFWHARSLHFSSMFQVGQRVCFACCLTFRAMREAVATVRITGCATFSHHRSIPLLYEGSEIGLVAIYVAGSVVRARGPVCGPRAAPST
ncbi:MAG TPA: hypothetical protein VD863_10055, partial [Bradyrhizobium sp.]|nr:hypothetical protein [Bradyrhizobium sp.]